jgi:hypothetical protein
MRTTCVLLIATALATIAGCPAPATPSGASPLKAGIYSGTVNSTVALTIDGARADNSSSSFDLTETVDAAGLPVLSTGVGARVGDEIVLGAAGANYLVGSLDTLAEDGNRLLLNYSITGVIDGVPVTGAGQTSYTAVNANTIEFSLTLRFSGTDGQGRVFEQTEDQTGALVR